ncbi:DUF2158 domain-containing protein [Pseudoduganella eburnea]|uniref:DUF2158 domain-containing protein n=1 Tax=Massilia eburnea TaxID=1776165 RepID=A0A6L6QG10_9BURK|nr:DUF2158 domain-containing protein [Massilia eburnea]
MGGPMSFVGAVFSAADLLPTYAPPSLREVMPGNRVMLRSGGPEMIVCDVTATGAAQCQWMVDGKLLNQAFPLECLTCFGAK